MKKKEEALVGVELAVPTTSLPPGRRAEYIPKRLYTYYLASLMATH